MQRTKFYCKPCDKVVKAFSAPSCPHCGTAMAGMGTQWRPGRRGTRTRMWDRRQEKPVPVFWWDDRPWWLGGSRYTSPQRPRPRVGRKRQRAAREARMRHVPQARQR